MSTMPEHADDPPVFKAKNVGHKVPSKKSPQSSKPKVNIILKNAIGPEEDIRKVKIPIDTPIHLLKKKIAELYGLDPTEFELSHIPNKGKNSEENPHKINVMPKDIQSAVRIILRDRSGNKKFQKKVNIPDDISIGELRDQVAEKLGMDSKEFNISLEKYL